MSLAEKKEVVQSLPKFQKGRQTILVGFDIDDMILATGLSSVKSIQWIIKPEDLRERCLALAKDLDKVKLNVVFYLVTAKRFPGFFVHTIAAAMRDVLLLWNKESKVSQPIMTADGSYYVFHQGNLSLAEKIGNTNMPTVDEAVFSSIHVLGHFLRKKENQHKIFSIGAIVDFFGAKREDTFFIDNEAARVEKLRNEGVKAFFASELNGFQDMGKQAAEWRASYGRRIYDFMFSGIRRCYVEDVSSDMSKEEFIKLYQDNLKKIQRLLESKIDVGGISYGSNYHDIVYTLHGALYKKHYDEFQTVFNGEIKVADFFKEHDDMVMHFRQRSQEFKWFLSEKDTPRETFLRNLSLEAKQSDKSREGYETKEIIVNPKGCYLDIGKHDCFPHRIEFLMRFLQEVPGILKEKTPYPLVRPRLFLLILMSIVRHDPYNARQISRLSVYYGENFPVSRFSLSILHLIVHAGKSQVVEYLLNTSLFDFGNAATALFAKGLAALDCFRLNALFKEKKPEFLIEAKHQVDFEKVPVMPELICLGGRELLPLGDDDELSSLLLEADELKEGACSPTLYSKENAPIFVSDIDSFCGIFMKDGACLEKALLDIYTSFKEQGGCKDAGFLWLLVNEVEGRITLNTEGILILLSLFSYFEEQFVEKVVGLGKIDFSGDVDGVPGLLFFLKAIKYEQASSGSLQEFQRVVLECGIDFIDDVGEGVLSARQYISIHREKRPDLYARFGRSSSAAISTSLVLSSLFKNAVLAFPCIEGRYSSGPVCYPKQPS